MVVHILNSFLKSCTNEHHPSYQWCLKLIPMQQRHNRAKTQQKLCNKTDTLLNLIDSYLV